MKVFIIALTTLLTGYSYAAKVNTRIDLLGVRSFHAKESSKGYYGYYPFTHILSPVLRDELFLGDDHWEGNSIGASIGYQGFLGEIELQFGINSLAEIKTRVYEVGFVYHLPKIMNVYFGAGYNYYSFSKSDFLGENSLAPFLSFRFDFLKALYVETQYYFPANDKHESAISFNIGLKIMEDTRPAWQQTGFDDEDE